MTYSILLLGVVIIVGVLSIHIKRMESFTGDLSVTSTMVAEDGNFTTDINTNDIEVISNKKKLGKICFNNSYDCLNKNNIISIFTATDINDSIMYHHNTLDLKLSNIEHWNKGTTDNTLKQYLRQQYSAKGKVYSQTEMDARFETVSEDKKRPYAFLEAVGNYLPKNSDEDPYLLNRSAQSRYYSMDSSGDPYLTQRNAKSLLEPIPKANQSPYIKLSDIRSNSGFSNIIPGLESVIEAEQQKENTYWESKFNVDRQARLTALQEINTKRTSVMTYINNTKVICNPAQANDYLYILRDYVSRSKSLVNKIKLKLIHIDHEDDKLLDNIDAYSRNIEDQYNIVEESAREISRIYINIMTYKKELQGALSIEGITKIEEDYNKDHSECKKYNTSLKTAESSAKTNLGKIEAEYNKLYQSSIINDSPNNETPQQKAMNDIYRLYIQCNTYTIDQYFNEVVKNTKEGYRLYSFLINQLDKAALTPEENKIIVDKLNGLYNSLTLSYQNSLNDRKLAYAEKETIYNQLLLAKSETQNNNLEELLRNANISYNKFNTNIVPSIVDQFKQSTDAIREIKELNIALPVRKQWILFNPYRVGYTKGYTLPYSNYALMTFSPNRTVKWNFNDPSLKKNLVGLRCIEANPTTINKNLAGIELLNPDGTTYTKGKLGRDNPFYIRIIGGENADKICKLDTSKRIVVASLDPGYFRDYTYYFYFEASHSPNWYYLRCLFKDIAMIQHSRFIRPTFATPKITEDDAFLWMIV